MKDLSTCSLVRPPLSTPGETGSADFTLPAGLPHGTYNLYVSACGISSKTAYPFTY